MGVRELGELHCIGEYSGKTYIVLGGTECGRYRLDIVEYKGDFEYDIVWTKVYESYGELKREYDRVKEYMG